MIAQVMRHRYLSFLESLLSPRRIRHSLGVMEVMGELAERYDLDRVQAETAGLLHDTARELSFEQLRPLAEEAGIATNYPCERLPVYLHGPVGMYLASQNLGITDQHILDAIAAHCYYGDKEHCNSPLALCLRVADIIAPCRLWQGMEKLKQTIYAGHLEEATLLQSKWLMEFLQERDVPVHPRITENFDTLSAKLGVAEDFFERW